MLIGTRSHTAGNKIRYTVDYSSWLDTGATLSTVLNACSVALAAPAPADVTLSGLQVNADHLYFFVAGGSVSEAFTVNVTVTDSRGEIDVATIGFSVIAP